MENIKQQIQTQEQNTTILIQAQEQSPSIKPSITESEKFIQFLNRKFVLNLPNDLIVLIQKTSPRIKGFFSPISWKQKLVFKQQKEKALNCITLSSHTLQINPYETLTHEVAHYVNFLKGIKDCSNNQYHNKNFKLQAEKLLLKVEKDKYRCFAYTYETEEFKQMLQEEFKPSPNAFKVFQELTEQEEKKGSRLLKYSCSCNCIIRSAKNENKPLKAICQYCNTKFIELLK